MKLATLAYLRKNTKKTTENIRGKTMTGEKYEGTEKKTNCRHNIEV